MTETKIYERAVTILDNFYGECLEIIKTIPQREQWKKQAIFTLFRQASNIIFALLSKTEKSKYLNSTYVTELIYIGTLGRIVRDIYVKIIYLRTTSFSDETMRLCWEFQIICQKLNVTKYELNGEFREEFEKLKRKKGQLEEELQKVMFLKKDKFCKEKKKKILSLQELATIKKFDKNKFETEFVFFSQFSHSTAFANSFITEQGVALSLIAATYHKIVAYYVGIVTESIDLFIPNHEQLEQLKIQYEEIIKVQWIIKPSA
jgi:hypothetical protein